MPMNFPILSLLIWLPILSAMLLFISNRYLSKGFLQKVAMLAGGVSLVLAVFLLLQFDNQVTGFQWQETVQWLPWLNIQYALGIDGFSVILIALTSLITCLVLFSSYGSVNANPHYMAVFLLLQGFLCGVFSALDSILFYFFWEGMLIPMFLIIGIWGGKNRVYAAFKFFLYTFLGSVFLLAAFIYLHHIAKRTGLDPNNSFLMTTFHALPLDLNSQKWIFWAFFIAFAIKVPMWPLHTWLPDAHVEAPTEGSVVLAAVLLKVGVYGFLRFLLPITPDASQLYAPLLNVLSLIAIMYIGLVAIAQKDIKKLIAYSSISHMGFATLGCFTGINAHYSQNMQSALLGIEGTIVQLISHGLISAALFFSIGMLYSRLHTRLIDQYGGIANRMPIFASLFMLFTLANTGLPGTAGFVGEFWILLSAFYTYPFYTMLGVSTLIFSAIYMLRLYKNTMFGEIVGTQVSQLKDIHLKERTILMSLSILIVILGVWPQPLLKLIHLSSENLVKQMMSSKLTDR